MLPSEGVSVLSRQQILPRALLLMGSAPSRLPVFLLQPSNVSFQSPVGLASPEILLLCVCTVVLVGKPRCPQACLEGINANCWAL